MKKSLIYHRRRSQGAREAVVFQRRLYTPKPKPAKEVWVERGLLTGAILISVGVHLVIVQVDPPPAAPRKPDQIRVNIYQDDKEEEKLPEPPKPKFVVAKQKQENGVGQAEGPVNENALQETKAPVRKHIETAETIMGTGALAALESGNEAVERAFDPTTLRQELDDDTKNLMPVSLNGLRGANGLGAIGAGTGGTGASLGIGPMLTPGGRGYKYASSGNDKGPKRPPNTLVALAPEAVINGGYSPDIVRRILANHASQLRYCYQKELNRDPALAGKIGVRFVIGGDGLINLAQIRVSTMKNQSVEECVVTAIKRIAFPAPKGGGIVDVYYPFLFKPSN